MKTQANNLNNSSSFPKIISPTKLLSNSWGSSVSGDNLLFYISTTPWLRLQQEAEWVNINFETRDLNSPQKSHPPPMILEKFAFYFVFNLRWKKCNRFFFHFFLTQNFVVCLKITSAMHCKFFHIVSTVAYQTMVARRCPLPLPCPVLDN